MDSPKTYKGLTPQEVIESRATHGSNVLQQPPKDGFLKMVGMTLRHWISVGMMILCLLSFPAMLFITPVAGHCVWAVPGMMSVATVMVILVGFFGGFRDPLFKILITAFVLSIGISIYEYEYAGMGFSTFLEPTGIIVALLLATGVAYALEKKNEKTFRSLGEMDDETLVKVLRAEGIRQVPRREIVVGDIVLLETGEEVPADCRLLEAAGLLVNESSLTGEPEAPKTTDEKLFDAEATYPSNFILKGTIVIDGSCTARVESVGNSTESGKVFREAQIDEGEPTPLSRKLARLATWITRASYAIASLVIVGRLIAYFLYSDDLLPDTTEEWIQFIVYLLGTMMIAVTLIVVAVPEGLPMSVTLSLAFSMRRLMKDGTLPRTLHACETMGAASVICTDKTGTLTLNQMRVAAVIAPLFPLEVIAEMVAINSTADLDFSRSDEVRVMGNPTEGALLLWLHEKGFDYRKMRETATLIERLSFSSENKYMVSVAPAEEKGKKRILVKGAPEILLQLSTLTEEERAEMEETLKSYQEKGMRTLALACADADASEAVISDGRLSLAQLTPVCFFAISDPIRSDVPAAIEQCRRAGIDVKIVTGDNQRTAREIGRQTGLWHTDENAAVCLTGAEFSRMSDEEVLPLLDDLKILSRARPTDKERLVRLLKKKGLVVAVTGDGTNDAPALNVASVGLSMGNGTAVAKEASDMTILDNSFSTIAKAVMWGRSIYKNIRRFILFQMTINVVACLIVLIGSFIGTQSPLTVTQMLWVNLIMDTFAALALASLPPEESVMEEKPRRETDNIISRPMLKNILLAGGLFTSLLLLLLLILGYSDIRSFSDLFHAPTFTAHYELTPYELSLFFTLFVMLQFWNMFNAKAFMTSRSAFAHLRSARGFLFVLLVIFLGQILIVEAGGNMMNTAPLPLSDWLGIIFLTSPVLWMPEIFRKIRSHN